MANLLKQGAELLDSIMRTSARETVSYRRGATQVDNLLAGFGEVGGEVLETVTPGGPGADLTYRTAQFVFTTADLVAAQLYPPQPGDQIIKASGSRFVLSSPVGDAVYRDSDEFGVATRVYAIRETA